MYDEIVPNGDKTKAITTTEPGVLSPEDAVIAHYFVTNTGNVPLEGVEWNYWGNGKSYFGWVPHLAPGNSSKVHILYSWPVTEKMTPGTETEDLLGTTTVKGYCIGIDPETFVGGDDYIAFASTTNHGKELCRTETIR